jgi:hypothetical protein
VFSLLALAAPAHDLLREEVSSAVFYAALVLPVLYLFFADAETYQPQERRAPVLLLAVLGLTATSLGVALLRVSLGTLTPETGETGFIRYVLVVPLAATVVALVARTPEEQA